MKDPSTENTTKKNVPMKSPARKVRSGIPHYALISLCAFLCCIAVLSLLIVNAGKLSQFGLLQQVYYLVLILMGLTAAVFLFGVLQSSADWTGQILGGTLTLSGSVVGAALVVVGGYYFIPKATSFPLTVYVHGELGHGEIVLRNKGSVSLKLGQEISSEVISENGQAVFPRIPSDFRGQEVPAWVVSDDYEATKPTVTLADSDVDLIVKKKVKRFHLEGTVTDQHENALPGVHVSLPMYRFDTANKWEDMTNEDGVFKLEVTDDHEQMVDLTAAKQGYQTAKFRPTLGNLGMNFKLCPQKCP